CISQVPAICHYLEQCFPDIPMFGNTSEDKALVTMWDHLGYINGFQAVAELLRNTSSAMARHPVVGAHDYEHIPQLAERGKHRTLNFFNDLNQRLSESEYLAGTFFSMADITAYIVVNFARWVKLKPGENLTALSAWQQRIAM